MVAKKSNYNLGELEAEIMEIIWRLKQGSVRQVLTQLRKKRPVAYTTVMTVMSRLADKKVLKREFDPAGAYIYTPVKNKEEFVAAASKKVINKLLQEFGEVAVAQFVDALEAGNFKNLEKWRKTLKKIK